MNVFYIECSGDHWIRVAQSLEKRAGWKPVYWTGSEEQATVVNDAFPGVIYHTGVDAARGVEADNLNNFERKSLDAGLIAELASDESIALQMMDRMDPSGHAFTYLERRRHYLDLVRYWNSILDLFRPDLVCFSLSPHLIFDYVLYALCKQRKVETRMFERIDVPGLLYVVKDFLDGSEKLESAYRECREHEISPSERLRHYAEILRDRRRTPLPPNYQKKLLMKGLMDAKGRQRIIPAHQGYWFELKRLTWICFRGNGLDGPPNYLKLAGQPPQRPMRLLRWARHRLGSVRKKRRLARAYERRVRLPTEDESFVVFALHYQPERATIPLAGQLGDQALVVDMVASQLPAGWRLYVKEHPWQLQPFSKGELARDEGFYERLERRANVAFLPVDMDTGVLLESAKAVVTGTGSLGWHGAIRGVPAMVFGSAWYRALDGIYPIASGEDVRHAIETIRQNPRVRWQDVMAMLAAVERTCRPGTLEPALEATEGLSIDEAVDGMCEALLDSIKQSNNPDLMSISSAAADVRA